MRKMDGMLMETVIMAQGLWSWHAFTNHGNDEHHENEHQDAAGYTNCHRCPLGQKAPSYISVPPDISLQAQR